MICPKCDGTGKAEIGVGAFTIHGADCDQCNGKGIVEPMTNEEWFCSLSTEEKAKRIINIAVNSDCDYKTIVEWLKQPHREE